MTSRHQRVLHLRRLLALNNKRWYYWLIYSAVLLTVVLGSLYVSSPEGNKEHYKTFWEFLSIAFGGFAAIFGGGTLFFTRRRETEQYFRLTCYATICSLFSFSLVNVTTYPWPAVILDFLLFSFIGSEFWKRKSRRQNDLKTKFIDAVVITLILAMIGVGGAMLLGSLFPQHGP